MYASTSESGTSSIYRSTDGGDSWCTLTGLLLGCSVHDVTGRRIQLAVSEDAPSVVYAVAANSSSGLEGIYKSTNSGASFSSVFTGSDGSLLGYRCDATGANEGQGWYDLCLAVDPNDADIIYLGGVNTFKSADGGNSWSNVNRWTSGGSYGSCNTDEVHADKHYLAFQNGSSTLFECNDGGLYKTTDGGSTWTDITNGMQISQMYRLGVSQNVDGEVLTGLQDNGTKSYNTNWSDVLGGDGMECIIDYDNNDTQYASMQNGVLRRTTNKWNSKTNITPNISDAGEWVTPYVLDPSDNQTIYVGYRNVYRSTNRGTNWSQISNLSIPSNQNGLTSIAIAESNNQVMYISNKSRIWRTSDGGANWNEITSNLPSVGWFNTVLSSRDLTYINIKSNDPNTVWITLGGYDSHNIYESTDGGNSWTNISSGLPNIPTMCVVQNKDNTQHTELYVGTDVGVYQKLMPVIGNLTHLDYQMWWLQS